MNTQLIEFPESDDEIRTLLGATIQRRDAAAAAGLAVEAESLNNLACRIDDEIRVRAKVAAEVRAVDCDELHRIYFNEEPPPKPIVGWTGKNGLE